MPSSATLTEKGPRGMNNAMNVINPKRWLGSARSSSTTMIDELVYRYMLQDQTVLLSAGELRCLRVYRSQVTRRVLAICQLPSGRRMVMPAQELLAMITF